MSLLATIVCYFWLAAMVACGVVLGWATVAPLFQCRHKDSDVLRTGPFGMYWRCRRCQRVELCAGPFAVVTPRRRVRRAA